jgi:Kef-type K+ transport system membrane component KefB
VADVAFVAIGIAVGPTGAGWVVGGDQIDLLAQLGIAVLLVLVGLRLDFHLIKTTGPVALATGLGQVLFTSIVGFAIALGLRRV